MGTRINSCSWSVNECKRRNQTTWLGRRVFDNVVPDRNYSWTNLMKIMLTDTRSWRRAGHNNEIARATSSIIRRNRNALILRIVKNGVISIVFLWDWLLSVPVCRHGPMMALSMYSFVSIVLNLVLGFKANEIATSYRLKIRNEETAVTHSTIVKLISTIA